MSRNDRLKHYGLHFAKYCGRLARDRGDETVRRTITDFALIAISATNTLGRDLSGADLNLTSAHYSMEEAYHRLMDASGRFCDGCEKIDHAEEFLFIISPACFDIINTLVGLAAATDFDLSGSIDTRRSELRQRAYYI